MQYTGAKSEKVDQNIPLLFWTRNLCSCNARFTPQAWAACIFFGVHVNKWVHSHREQEQRVSIKQERRVSSSATIVSAPSLFLLRRLRWIKVTVYCSWSKLTRLTLNITNFTIKSCKWCVSQSPYEKIKCTKTHHFHELLSKLQRSVKLIKQEAFVSFNITFSIQLFNPITLYCWNSFQNWSWISQSVSHTNSHR